MESRAQLDVLVDVTVVESENQTSDWGEKGKGCHQLLQII